MDFSNSNNSAESSEVLNMVRDYKKLLKKGNRVKYFDRDNIPRHIELTSGTSKKWKRAANDRWYNCRDLDSDRNHSVNLPTDGTKHYLAYDPNNDQEPVLEDGNLTPDNAIQESSISLTLVTDNADEKENEDDDSVKELMEIVPSSVMDQQKHLIDQFKTLGIITNIGVRKYVDQQKAQTIIFETKQLVQKVIILYSRAQAKH